MPISQKFLINYLEHFNVSELKQINKYFNQRVSKQNGGGSLNKQELIWNLVGGASNRLDKNISSFEKGRMASIIARITATDNHAAARNAIVDKLTEKGVTVTIRDLCDIVKQNNSNPTLFNLKCEH